MNHMLDAWRTKGALCMKTVAVIVLNVTERYI